MHCSWILTHEVKYFEDGIFWQSYTACLQRGNCGCLNSETRIQQFTLATADHWWDVVETPIRLQLSLMETAKFDCPELLRPSSS